MLDFRRGGDLGKKSRNSDSRRAEKVMLPALLGGLEVAEDVVEAVDDAEDFLIF